MLYRHMIGSKVNIVSNHLQSGVPQYLLQGKHVPTIDKKSGGKGVMTGMERPARLWRINRENEGECNGGVDLVGLSRSYQDCQRQTSSGDNSGNKESGHIITIRIK